MSGSGTFAGEVFAVRFDVFESLAHAVLRIMTPPFMLPEAKCKAPPRFSRSRYMLRRLDSLSDFAKTSITGLHRPGNVGSIDEQYVSSYKHVSDGSSRSLAPDTTTTSRQTHPTN